MIAITRGIVILALAALVGLLAYGLAAQAPDTTIDDSLASGKLKPAPAFSLPVLSGGMPPAALQPLLQRATADGKLALRELRGAPVVLNFWASWCEPCRAEAGVLERGWQRAAQQGVLVLGLNQQDATSDARRFLERYEVSYPNVREAGRETSRRYGMTGLPETFFISAKGQVVGHVTGAVDAAQLRQGIEAARTGTPITARPGGGSS